MLAAEEGEAVTIAVCHHAAAAATLWARHTLHDELAARDTGNNRPSFDPEFFDFDVDHFYKVLIRDTHGITKHTYTSVSVFIVSHSHFCQTETQRQTVAELVGSQELADQYIGDQSSQLFLSRGHLAPNADFVFYSWQEQTCERCLQCHNPIPCSQIKKNMHTFQPYTL